MALLLQGVIILYKLEGNMSIVHTMLVIVEFIIFAL